MLSLKRTELATEEDKKYAIDHWANLFKATTWEELRMIAEKNPPLAEAAKTVYKMSDDERIRQLCFARKEHYRILAGAQEEVEMAKSELSDAKEELAHAKSELSDAKEELAHAKSELTNTQSELADTQSELADTQSKLANVQAELERLRAQIAEQ